MTSWLLPLVRLLPRSDSTLQTPPLSGSSPLSDSSLRLDSSPVRLLPLGRLRPLIRLLPRQAPPPQVRAPTWLQQEAVGHQWISAPGEAASASPRAKFQTRKPHLSNGYDQPQDFGGLGRSGGGHWNLHERYITPKPPNGTHCPSHAPAPDQGPTRGVGTDQGPV